MMGGMRAIWNTTVFVIKTCGFYPAVRAVTLHNGALGKLRPGQRATLRIH
ncbi:hypothetical protein SDC9_211361 [bioreactor metagenome]|uniref:Uncharacterized protein n=1 Tax=bioreactor metagenome TaxID=1076179 RepID=A0A645JJQ6_9ZZZZ